MTAKEFCSIASRIMRHPAAPYHEHAVRSEVETLCRENGLYCRRDRFGNVIVTLRTDRKATPVVLAAHMDHPGFEIVRKRTGSPLAAQFLGGVPDDFFRAGIRLRLMPGKRTAVLGRRLSKTRKVFAIQAPVEAPTPEFAVWELEDFRVEKGRIHGRACDDLIGVASILSVLVELKRSRSKVHVIGLISRAEEVGFHGALTLAEARVIPRDGLVISLETSRELPGAAMGKGVIVRVGDRASIFDSSASRFLSEVGSALSKRRKNFAVQRALMSGGTCEATAYQEFGFRTAAVCVALGNYHNCGTNRRIRAEFVSLDDALGMVELLVSAARRIREFESLSGRLSKRLQSLLREAKPRLLRNA